MSISEKLLNIFRQRKDQVEAALSDEARDGHYEIVDMENKIVAFEAEIKEAMTETIGLQQDLTNAQADVVKFQRLAEKAAQAQNGDDVREALSKKAQAQSKADRLQTTITANQKVQDAARDHIAEIRQQIEDAKNSEAQNKVRISSANLREKLAQSTVRFGEKAGFPNVNRLSEAADKAEARAQASEQLAADSSAGSAANLEAKYGDNGSQAVDDEASKLMAQFAAK